MPKLIFFTFIFIFEIFQFTLDILLFTFLTQTSMGNSDLNILHRAITMPPLSRQLIAEALVPCTQPITFPQHDNFKPLNLPCKFYHSGRCCPGERKGYCPFDHDMNVRKKSLDKKKLKKPRQNLQQQYSGKKVTSASGSA